MGVISLKQTRLPYTHGIEVELQILNDDGSWISGETIVDIFNDVITKAKEIIEELAEKAEVPIIKERFLGLKIVEKDPKKGTKIVVKYKLKDGNVKEFDIMSRDPHIATVTYILEVVTPPCDYLEELAWWVHVLVSSAEKALPAEKGVILVSTGLNPTLEYFKGLSFGEHHHILGPEIPSEEKLAVYNLLRNFIPHIIALTVNSPIVAGKPTDEIRELPDGRIRAPRCIRSIRLQRNCAQLGPCSDREYIPYMVRESPEEFAHSVNRDPPRMVDMYPFTDYGTIELRCVDTQLSIPRRIGIAAIIQAIALKASKLYKAGKQIPDVGKKSIISNRERAVSAGLWGRFEKPENLEKIDPEFAAYYSYKIGADGRPDTSKVNRYLADAVEGLIAYIKDELDELDLIDNEFLQPLFVSVFGSSTVEPRTTTADFQLIEYYATGNNVKALLRKLVNITEDCSTNWLYDPLSGIPHLPGWLRWWTEINVDIDLKTPTVFTGNDVLFTVKINNGSTISLSNVAVQISVQNGEKETVFSDTIPVGNIPAGEIVPVERSFSTHDGSSSYVILAVAKIGTREIKFQRSVNTYRVKCSIKPEVDHIIPKMKTLIPFKASIWTNYPEDQNIIAEIKCITSSGELLAEDKFKFVLPKEGKEVFDHEKLNKIKISPEDSVGLKRCHLELYVKDEFGNIFTQTRSDNFYVSFRGPQISISYDMPSKIVNPDIDKINVELFVNSHSKISPSELEITVYYSIGKSSKKLLEVLHIDKIPDTISVEVPIPKSEESLELYLYSHVKYKGQKISVIQSPPILISQLQEIQIESIYCPSSIYKNSQFNVGARVKFPSNNKETADVILGIRTPSGSNIILEQNKVVHSGELYITFGLINPWNIVSNFEYFTIYVAIKKKNKIVDIKQQRINVIHKKEINLDVKFSKIKTEVTIGSEITNLIQIKNNSEINADVKVTYKIYEMSGHIIHQESHIVKLNGFDEKFVPLQILIPVFLKPGKYNLTISIESDEAIIKSYMTTFNVMKMDGEAITINFRFESIRGEPYLTLLPSGKLIHVFIDVYSRITLKGKISLDLLLKHKKEIIDTLSIELNPLEENKRIVIGPLDWTVPYVEDTDMFVFEPVLRINNNRVSPELIKVENNQIRIFSLV